MVREALSLLQTGGTCGRTILDIFILGEGTSFHRHGQKNGHTGRDLGFTLRRKISQIIVSGDMILIIITGVRCHMNRETP